MTQNNIDKYTERTSFEPGVKCCTTGAGSGCISIEQFDLSFEVGCIACCMKFEIRPRLVDDSHLSDYHLAQPI